MAMKLDLNQKLDIQKLAQHLDQEVTLYTSCPICNATHEKSFSVTKNADGILFNCFRVKCGAKGFIPLKEHVQYKREEVKKGRKIFRGISFEYLQSLHPKDLDDYKFYVPKLKATVYLIRDNQNMIYAYQLKPDNKEDYGGRKYVFVPNENLDRYLDQTIWGHMPEICQYESNFDKHTWVLVEDVDSAEHLAKHKISTVALLGTSLNEKIITKIFSEVSIVLALDPDAFAKAIEYKLKYGSLCNKFTVLKLDKDPKHLTPEEIEREIKPYVV